MSVFHSQLEVGEQTEQELSSCPVLLLVGGLGTRLRSAYADGPKAMAPIQGRPFLAYILKQLSDARMSRVILCVGYRAGQIEQWLGDGRAFGLQVSYSHEVTPLGTAGALVMAYSRCTRGERVLAMNGDSVLQFSLQEMWNAHLHRKAEATVALAQVEDTSRYGSIEVSAEGWVDSFREKQSGSGAGFINGGIYLFEPSVMESALERCCFSLEREVLPRQIERGLLAFKTDGYFIDIGVPEDFARAQTELWNR